MRWLYYMLGWLQLDAVSRDSAVPGLNREAAYQRISLYPPLPEQHAIVKYMDRAAADIDAAIGRLQHQIELAQEYRTRLISDVVTGKLDVRETAAQLPDEAGEEEPIGRKQSVRR